MVEFIQTYWWLALMLGLVLSFITLKVQLRAIKHMQTTGDPSNWMFVVLVLGLVTWACYMAGAVGLLIAIVMYIKGA